MIPAVILAGGRATRMGGGDKGRLALGGRSLLEHVITRLKPQVGEIALNANGDASRFDDLGLTVLEDSVSGHPGPLAGVLAGLDWAAGLGAEALVSVAADTPFFPNDLSLRLKEGSQGAGVPIALAASRDADGKLWRQPTFGLWPVALRNDLRASLQSGLRKVVLWTDKHGAVEVEFPAETHDPFFNVNTPEDLRTAQAIAESLA